MVHLHATVFRFCLVEDIHFFEKQRYSLQSNSLNYFTEKSGPKKKMQHFLDKNYSSSLYFSGPWSSSYRNCGFIKLGC